ncbi:hypothetical protein ACFU53_30055 [Streptomyces sp. NPDC057474]|uniref:hypothetical protein n=1 Tax=Streptomyces sp. NPDC057474 TaxID=3346144 RepID=UPI0036BA0116
MDALIARAAVAEREEGSTWTELGAAAGIARQSASEKWAPAFAQWSAGGRTALRGSSGLTAMDAVVSLDAAYARIDPDRPRDAFSSGLDAFRFPGAEAAEKARVERAAATHARLAELADEARLLRTRFRTRSADGGSAADRAALLRSRASVQDEGARLLEELTGLEPELADEYRVRAEEARSLAAADREFADLLAQPGLPHQ